MFAANRMFKLITAGAVTASILCTSAFATTVKAKTDVNIRSGPDNSYSVVRVLPKNATAEKLGTSGNWVQLQYKDTEGYVYKTYLTEAAASKTTKVYVTASALNVRAEPNAKAKKLGTLKKDTAVETYALKDGWYQIKYNGKTAYICAKYTTKTAPVKITRVYVTASTLNVRAEPNTKAKKLGTLKKGAAVDTYALKNGWYQIKYNGKTAYIKEQYTTKTAPVKTTTVYVTAETLNVRAEPNAKAKKLGTLKKDTAVETYALKDGWYKIKFRGQTAYISAKYTTKTAPVKITTVYVTAETLNVRAQPNTTSKVLGTFKKGSAVETYELKDGWYKIKFGGQTAYINAKYTSKTAPVKAKAAAG